MTTERPPPARARAPRKADAPREKEAPPPGSIADTYRAAMPAIAFEAEQTKWDVALTVDKAYLHNVLDAGRHHQALQMDLLRNLTAVDWEDAGLEVVYNLYSITLRHAVTIKTWVPAENAALPTATDIYRGAEWAEREAREMFAITFEGHPDPRNLLLDEDLDLPLLRKSHPLAPIEMKQGVDVEYFTKQHPPDAPKTVVPEEAGADAATAPDDDRTKRIAAAKARAEAATAGAQPEKKAVADLTPEERAARKAEQAERIQRARALAAARRAGQTAPAPAGDTPAPALPAETAQPATAATAQPSEAPAPAAPEAKPAELAAATEPPAAAEPEATAAAAEPPATAAPARPAPATPARTPAADLTPDERVARARALAAELRAAKKREREGS